MRKRALIAASAVTAVVGISAQSAMAAPPDRAGDDAFVCPVLKISENAKAATGEKFNQIGDGEYTFGTGNAGDPVTFTDNVPLNATNGDDGEGTPGSDHSSPGDTNYTPIWSGDTDPQ